MKLHACAHVRVVTIYYAVYVNLLPQLNCDPLVNRLTEMFTLGNGGLFIAQRKSSFVLKCTIMSFVIATQAAGQTNVTPRI